MQRRTKTARRAGRWSAQGSTLIESTLALWTLAIMVGGIMEVGFAGLVANSLEFSAQRAARYASVRGSSSGHAATISDIQSVAQQYATPLNPVSLTVTVSWTPANNNNPGSTVQVQTGYSIVPSILPLDSGMMKFQATARQIILQ
jgi:Flp pilus assembly protein TadG